MIIGLLFKLLKCDVMSFEQSKVASSAHSLSQSVNNGALLPEAIGLHLREEVPWRGKTRASPCLKLLLCLEPVQKATLDGILSGMTPNQNCQVHPSCQNRTSRTFLADNKCSDI